MTLELPFLYTDETLDRLADDIISKAAHETRIQFLWQWQPFHQPFFDAASFAVSEKWTWRHFENHLGQLSCTTPPARLKKNFTGRGLLDDDGCIKSLDLEPVLRESFALAREKLDLFENRRARLFTVANLEATIQKCSKSWQPDIESVLKTGISASVVSSFSSKSPVVMKRFHGLSAWQKLSFFEPLVGVAKSSTFLHFQRIDALQ